MVVAAAVVVGVVVVVLVVVVVVVVRVVMVVVAPCVLGLWCSCLMIKSCSEILLRRYAAGASQVF